MINEETEKMIRDNREKRKTVRFDNKEEYTDTEKLFDSIPYEEKMQVKKLVNDMVNARIDFSQMRNNEV